MADGVSSVLVIVDGDKKYPTVIGPSVIMKYLVVRSDKGLGLFPLDTLCKCTFFQTSHFFKSSYLYFLDQIVSHPIKEK